MNIMNDISAEELIDRYSDMVYRVAFSRTQNVEDAKDITQEVFLKYLKHTQIGNTFQEEEHRKAWLLKVAVNTGNTFVKTAWFRHRASLTEISDTGKGMEEKSEVYYAVMALPEKYRLVIHLFYYEELSIKEIGTVLKLSETAVKSRLHRAREVLKEKLKGAEYEF